ncbi:MAG: hypothetical protein CENE_02073 [Candidatus Celerinatantimonas neptuna]|nr:MAG: hypothetical protein CENE_02073 [Candidatus Celerinatantimonas neptuna]
MSRKTDRVLITLLLLVGVFWLVIPMAMAVLWSLVAPGHPWSYPELLPPLLSLKRWVIVWSTTSLPNALLHSYTLAPCVALSALVLAMPTAYAFGRLEFAGKFAAQLISLLPLVMPGFVTALFFASVLFSLGIQSAFVGIWMAHIVLFLPYAIRILSVSFALVRQDHIDAAKDMGASAIAVFRHAYLPVLWPGIIASLIIVFIQSIEEFGVSFIIGSPDFITVPTILYSYLGYNFIRPNAAVVSLILVVPNVILMLVFERVLAKRQVVSIAGKG